MQSATRKSESGSSDTAGRKAAASKRAKLSVLLVTRDDTLWPQIGVHLSKDLIPKQVDSIDELLTATSSGQSGIVLWDARNYSDSAAALSRMQLHSPRFAVVVLDDGSNAHTWTNAVAQRQVIGHVPLPVHTGTLTVALASAREEVNARVALLGEDEPAAADAASRSEAASGDGSSKEISGARKIPWIPIAVVAAVAIAGGAYVALKPADPAATSIPVAKPEAAPVPQAPSQAPAAADEKVDLLIDKARQAMLDRHYIDPAEGSALALYRSALLLDPDNGEAHQGLQRLAEILFTRVQSALDERKFDVALQSLETARSINPGDGRLSALDERIASLRAEFGPAQILAAINAQNFDRAGQLIDEAARSKSLSAGKLAQLREELRRRREDVEVANFVKLIDTRMQQDRWLEPRNDSAIYYLSQARAAGATSVALQPQSQDIYKKAAQIVHSAIEQRHFNDADHLMADLRGYGAPAAMLAGLQRDLNAAHSQPSVVAPEPPSNLDLAQSRLAQGKITEPENDSALYYVNQLRAADPKNGSLARISNAVQLPILDQARLALDAGQPAKADALLQLASPLGASADLAALNQRLAQVKLAAAGPPQVVEASLTRVKKIQLEYPEKALRQNIEGWVDLAYVVTADGKVNNVKVLDSSPAGVFDAAAARAIGRIRYQPPMDNGKATSVSTKLRIAFRVAN